MNPSLAIRITCLVSIISKLKFADAASIFHPENSMESLSNLNETSNDASLSMCRNNLDYLYPKNPQWGCQAIQFIETRRRNLCSELDVRLNCPISCGICCEDDPFYTFTRLNGDGANCDWLSKNEVRKNRYCELNKDGRMVRAGCPNTCSYCRSFVSVSPTDQPSQVPTLSPSKKPSKAPSTSPSARPTSIPSMNSSEAPSAPPSSIPTIQPSKKPSKAPSTSPSVKPTNIPSMNPSKAPSAPPSFIPTIQPTTGPSTKPSIAPSTSPSATPTQSPSMKPSKAPSAPPTAIPTARILPTVIPSAIPSNAPSALPTTHPTLSPTSSPTAYPSSFPSSTPSEPPSREPSIVPSMSPTTLPTEQISASPSLNPSPQPTFLPTTSPSTSPSISPTSSPSRSPSTSPSLSPSNIPSFSPTYIPSTSPSAIPTTIPSKQPSQSPTYSPTTNPSTIPSSIPSSRPTGNPTRPPTRNPSLSPSENPTSSPSQNPTSLPSQNPTENPSGIPSESPTLKPTSLPSKSPTSSPSSSPTESPTEKKPNLIMILTDEHNMRTLSCYRDYLLGKHRNAAKVDVWGDVFLNTPNIDSLADEGAIFSNYYTVAPLCTPSRASFMSGLYPTFTGDSKDNHGKMDASITTWAEILRANEGYHTGYMGKWHLDGEEKPLWGSNNRDFGFEDNKYRFNRGHWKYFNETNGDVQAFTIDSEGNFKGEFKEHFATDFLMDRGIEFIKAAVSNNDPFALVLSIPDPHGPNDNRPYYRNMFNDINFKVPESARRNWKFQPAPPGFNHFPAHEAPPADNVDNWITEYENGPFWQKHMRQYYGMVKCIDHNVGKLLEALKTLGIDDDTILVFTSDHGDTLMEHGKLNKGRPYESAAGIPFLVRYPKKVPAGKVIETTRSSVDFAPTILGLMGVEIPVSIPFQGVDGSKELMNNQKLNNDESQIIFSFDTGKSPIWAAAIKAGYKLVFSRNDIPWLFDVNIDPEEMANFIESPSHQDILNELRPALIDAMKKLDIPLTQITNTIFVDIPACYDSRDILPLNNGKTAFCSDIGKTINFSKCEAQQKVKSHCPYKCKACCEDSVGLLWVKEGGRGCNTLESLCDESKKVRQFCPQTCGLC